MAAQDRPAGASGTLAIGGDMLVVRLGFGSMQLTGPGVWGDPADPANALRVLRRAVDLGVTLIDTADSYGPFVAERLIRRALHPYPRDLVIATKSGRTRPGPDRWHPLGRPEYLRQQAELSLRNLGVDRIDLYQLHRIDRNVPLEDQVGEFRRLQEEGKVRHIGLSEVTVDNLVAARAIAEIASVQNLYNLSDRSADPLLDYCEGQGIAFIPWFPLATGELAKPDGRLAEIASRMSATPSQLALAWLLRRSHVMLPIPGTASLAHLEENVAAAGLGLSDSQFEELSNLD